MPTTLARRIMWWLSGLEEARVSARLGSIIVYPTDTVYGIGCDPRREESVKLVFNIKRRSPDKPVPLLLDSIESATEIGEFNSEAKRLAEKFWPGGLTLIVPLKDPSIAREVTAGTGCVGLRVPAHIAPRVLAESVGGAFVGTSANISGRPSKKTIDEVIAELGEDERIDIFLDGGLLLGTPSTVLNLCVEPPRVERIGAVPVKVIEKILGRKLVL